MKYLKIERGKAYFWRTAEYVEIDKIAKADLLVLIEKAEDSDFEIDQYDEAVLQNRAHRVIYQNLASKLDTFMSDKDAFNREVERLYGDAIKEYKASNEGGPYSEDSSAAE